MSDKKQFNAVNTIPYSLWTTCNQCHPVFKHHISLWSSLTLTQHQEDNLHRLSEKWIKAILGFFFLHSVWKYISIDLNIQPNTQNVNLWVGCQNGCWPATLQHCDEFVWFVFLFNDIWGLLQFINFSFPHKNQHATRVVC